MGRREAVAASRHARVSGVSVRRPRTGKERRLMQWLRLAQRMHGKRMKAQRTEAK
jgi:hypothetical protein